MSHLKYQALAERATQRRLEHQQKLPAPEEASFQHRTLQLPQDPGNTPQLPFPFAQHGEFLDVFHQFNPIFREVEWSYYTSRGEFLLHFSFRVEERSYQIITVHPELIRGRGAMGKYLTGIREDLSSLYPGLELISIPQTGPTIRPCEQAG